MTRATRESCNPLSEQAPTSIADAMRPLNGERQAVHDTDRERAPKALSSGPATDVEAAERPERKEECFSSKFCRMRSRSDRMQSKSLFYMKSSIPLCLFLSFSKMLSRAFSSTSKRCFV